LIRPPSARVGPLTADERNAIIAKSPFKGRYDVPIDPISAYEILQQKHAGGAKSQAPATGSAAPSGGGVLGGLGGMLGGVLGAQQGHGGRMTATEVMVKQVARTAGAELGRAVIRGLLGSLSGKK
jgi:hypothetical protein